MQDKRPQDSGFKAPQLEPIAKKKAPAKKSLASSRSSHPRAAAAKKSQNDVVTLAPPKSDPPKRIGNQSSKKQQALPDSTKKSDASDPSPKPSMYAQPQMYPMVNPYQVSSFYSPPPATVLAEPKRQDDVLHLDTFERVGNQILSLAERYNRNSALDR